MALTLHQTLADLDYAPGDRDAFPHAQYTAESGTVIRVPTRIWDDMGHPAHITVTVQPGDTLNHEGN